MARRYTVREVARVSHVTIRALHHYDEIGLLVPSRRSSAGYRLYTDDDLARLQQICVLRALGFSLEVVRELLAGDGANLRRALELQRARLYGELASKQAVLRALEAALALSEGKKELDMADIFEGFESFEHPPYEDEARQRWGDTDSYRESARRTKRYTKADWEQLKREGDAVMACFEALLANGESADSDAARDAAEQHRLHIDRWFYPCNHAQHVALSELYLADARFTAYFEQRATGLAAFVAASIRANQSRQSA